MPTEKTRTQTMDGDRTTKTTEKDDKKTTELYVYNIISAYACVLSSTYAHEFKISIIMTIICYQFDRQIQYNVSRCRK